jgi:glycine betaine/proline transport system substrate-binding protein
VLLINSSDADFIDSVYGEVLKKVGYRVRYVQADYAASYTAIVTGDIDVSLAAWQTTGVEMTKSALESGAVENYGPTGVKVTEGWWYSDKAKEACPDLPKWEALKEASCVAAFATAETAPKGRYLDAPADWATGSEKAISDSGLDFTLINSGSPATLIATVKGAEDRGEAILSWGYLPHPMFGNKPNNFVELPGFRHDLDILKLAHKETFDKITIAAAILKNFTISSDDVAKAMDSIENHGVTAEQAARDWMNSHSGTWEAWVPK